MTAACSGRLLLGQLKLGSGMSWAGMTAISDTAPVVTESQAAAGIHEDLPN